MIKFKKKFIDKVIYDPESRSKFFSTTMDTKYMEAFYKRHPDYFEIEEDLNNDRKDEFEIEPIIEDDSHYIKYIDIEK